MYELSKKSRAYVAKINFQSLKITSRYRIFDLKDLKIECQKLSCIFEWIREFCFCIDHFFVTMPGHKTRYA